METGMELVSQYGIGIAALCVVVYTIKTLTNHNKNSSGSIDMQTILAQNTRTIQRNNEIISELAVLIRQQGNSLQQVLERLDELWREAVKK